MSADRGAPRVSEKAPERAAMHSPDDTHLYIYINILQEIILGRTVAETGFRPVRVQSWMGHAQTHESGRSECKRFHVTCPVNIDKRLIWHQNTCALGWGIFPRAPVTSPPFLSARDAPISPAALPFLDFLPLGFRQSSMDIRHRRSVQPPSHPGQLAQERRNFRTTSRGGPYGPYGRPWTSGPSGAA
jgi:hypothetical protein